MADRLRNRIIRRAKNLLDWHFNVQRVGGDEARWIRRPETVRTAICAGVGNDITFELQLGRTARRVILMDPTPIATQYIRTVPLPDHVRFYPVGLGPDGEQDFSHQQPDGGWAVGTGERFWCMSVKRAMHLSAIERLDLLKMNIEGWEYAVLSGIVGLPIQQIAVSFHDRWQGIPTLRTLAHVAALCINGYTPIAKQRSAWTFYRREHVDNLEWDSERGAIRPAGAAARSDSGGDAEPVGTEEQGRPVTVGFIKFLAVVYVIVLTIVIYIALHVL